jgi:spore coat polysaccharide biosynthesis protein SpsF
MKNNTRPRTVVIIQARMASSRLPGKVLMEIAGRPMLSFVVARASRSASVDAVVVATTTDPSDDAVVEYCQRHGIDHTRGSQFDVLDRYYQAARHLTAGTVVRITADCPAIDPQLIDDAVGTLHGNPREHTLPPQAQFDFVANRLPPPFHRTFPIGLDVEVCSFAALERAWKEGHEAQHREHVMPYLYEGLSLSAASPELSQGISPRGFRVGLLNHTPDFGSYRWTVDTLEDLEFMRELYGRFGGRDDFSWNEALDVVHREPALMSINAGVQHKTLRDFDSRATGR